MANLALNKYATASGYMAPFTPSRTVNADVTPINRWVFGTVPCWMSVDLGTTYWVNQTIVKMMGLSGWTPAQNYNMCDFKIQGSLDNANWFDLDSVTNNSANQYQSIITPRKARYTRVYVTKGLRINNWLAAVEEFEVYETPNAPYLSNLTLSTGTLTPGFSGHTFTYSTSVANNVPNIKVTPTAVNNNSIIKVNGQVVQSGQQSQDVNLTGVSTVIPVEVSSPDDLMKETYNITVNKEDTSALLSNLTLNVRGTTTVPLNPTFDSNILAYTATVSTAQTSVTVTPTVLMIGTTVTVNGESVASGLVSQAISVATTPVTIEVITTSPSGNHKTYTIIVSK